MAKKTSEIKKAGSALDMLVRQFSQPLACLRELVQNAIDAGSNFIDVSLVRDAKEKCLKLTVADTGEGMNEHIIQTQLTRLFSSSKENDLTKVGKFGIGFVSVFSLNPTAVVVDTGRDGQSWRVLFDQDHKFDLIKLPQTVEGTTVTLYLPESGYKLSALLAEVEKTLIFWCRHCKPQIHVNGKSIQKPFCLDAPIQVFYEETGTRLVLRPTLSEESFFGYYNQGLTLLEGIVGSPVPHVTFKIDSRYFEHTLTRDNIRRDDHYEKAMALLKRVAAQEIPKKLFAHLLKSDNSEDWDLLEVLPKVGVPNAILQAAALFPDHSGHYHSLASLKGHEVFYQVDSDPVQEAVHDPKCKRIVLKLNRQHPAVAYLAQYQRIDEVAHHWGLCEAQTEHGMEDLAAVSGKLGAKAGGRALQPVRWLSSQKVEFLRRAPKIGLVRWDQPGGDVVLVNVDHPVYQPLLQLARWSAPLACQVLLQHLLLLRAEKEREALSMALSQGVLEQLA